MQDYYYKLEITSNISDFLKSFLDEFNISFEEQKNRIIVRDEDSLEDLEENIALFAKTLSQRLGINLDFEIEHKKLKNEDWIKKYQEGIKEIEVGDFFIRASWHKENPNLINIIIDPALAFGSGHHESTNSCLKLISKYAEDQSEVLDIGCGSGILSIAMAKKGLIVDACDTDELAIVSTNENFKKNSVSLRESWIGSADETLKRYDVVVANIIADVILMIKKDLKNRLKRGSLLILSGILDLYEDRVLEAFKDLKLIERYKKNEWVSLVFKNET
jgi:ribosomal protein L11 methyltransferase